MYLVTKETRLNIRITPEFRAELEELADFYALKMSSYAHSLLVRAVRLEREKLTVSNPDAFKSEPTVNAKRLAPNSKTKIPLLNRPKEARRKTG